MFTIGDVVELAIQIEKNGEAFFRDARRIVKSPHLMEALSWMADEEARHGRWFANLRERAAEREADPRLAKIGRQLLMDYLGEQTFSLKDADLPGMRSLWDLLKLAEEFERDTVVFYEMLGAAIEVPETLLQLKQIIAEEQRHASFLAHCSTKESEEAALQALLSVKDSGS